MALHICIASIALRILGLRLGPDMVYSLALEGFMVLFMQRKMASCTDRTILPVGYTDSRWMAEPQSWSVLDRLHPPMTAPTVSTVVREQTRLAINI